MPEIISRKEARALGLKRYFTGKTCSRGHVVERLVSEAECLECYNARKRRSAKTRPRSRRARLLRGARGRAAAAALLELGVNLGHRPVQQKAPIMAFSRSEALAMGVIRYFTGKPCKHGHITSRNVNNGCDECRRLYGLNHPSLSKGKKETRADQKKRARYRQRAALKALIELGIQI